MEKLNESKFDLIVDPILKPLKNRLDKIAYIFAKREYKIEKYGTHKIRDQYLLSSERLFEIWVSSEYSVNASITNLSIDDYLFFTDFLKKKTKETHLDLIEQLPN